MIYIHRQGVLHDMDPPYILVCSICHEKTPGKGSYSWCADCGGYLEYTFDPEYLKTIQFKGPITFWRYAPVMPRVERAVSLGEGGTPYWKAERLGEHLGLRNLHLKDETRNPTSSFKDRAAALIMSDAIGKGFDSVVCATNGNHGASLAAYSAREDVSCRIVVPTDLDLGKLAQMIASDAHVEEAGDGIDVAIEKARKIAEETGAYQATTELNPLSMEALKTVSYELVEQSSVPDWVAVAMGSGVTIHSLWKGFTELEEAGKINSKPRLIGVQAKGCAPISDAFNKHVDAPLNLESGDTIASAIRVASPMYGAAALRALKESDGLSVTVMDSAMIDYGKEIARHEGIFAEPASAASVAFIPEFLESGVIDESDTVVSIITSSGLKTNDIIRSLDLRRKSPGLGIRLATKERILRRIASKKTYGYALWKELGKEMTLGAVYQHLTDLESRGLIASTVEGKRRYLELTEKGVKVLGALEDLQSLM
jgi:threonine synthase